MTQTQIANPRIAEMNDIVSRILLNSRTVVALKDLVADEDKEILDLLGNGAESLNTRFAEAVASDEVASNPTHELGRGERHDLRNNITAVLGFSELMLHTYTAPEALVSQLTKLKEDSRRFTDLTLPPETAQAPA